MNISKYDFTEKQLAEIFRLYDKFYQCNNGLTSNCKIDGIQTYINRENDFFCSYYYHEMTDGGLKGKCEYVKISTEGEVVDLNELYIGDVVFISQMMNKMEEIKLS